MAVSQPTPRGALSARTPRGVSASVEPGGTLAIVAGGAGLAVLSTWFGYLDGAGPHPTLKIGLAMTITVGGLGGVLLVRLVGPRAGAVTGDVLRTGLALLSVAGALIHFAVVRQHLIEYWLYGWFFVGVAVAQLVWAVLVVLRSDRWLLWLGAIMNALVALTWGVTRTYGTLIGPDATRPEKVGFGDVASTVFEAAIVVGIVFLLARGTEEHGDRSQGGDLISGVVALVATPLTALSLYSAVGGHPFVSHVG